jgi:hypothetical protein
MSNGAPMRGANLVNIHFLLNDRVSITIPHFSIRAVGRTQARKLDEDE